MIARIIPAACAIAMSIGLGSPALAQPTVDLKGDVKVIHSVTENGTTRETYTDPDRVLPGDRLVFTTRYTNNGADAVEDFVVTNPLPGPVKLAQNGAFLVSIDGGRTFGPLASFKVDSEDGKRAAELGDVTHVQWTLARVAPGVSGQVKYFAEVR